MFLSRLLRAAQEASDLSGFLSCHRAPPSTNHRHQKDSEHLTIALAGNANVGKSVVFNQLTGSSQIIGNWPGKTVEKAEGTLRFEGYDITVIDLPGIYSFSTFSLEELVTKEYIAFERPDLVVNVIDASLLERNLYLTIQLMEMDAPLVVCLNQTDIAEKKGLTIDAHRLEAALGVPVVPTVATRGKGIRELVKTAVETAQRKRELKKTSIRYGEEVETRISRLAELVEAERVKSAYPSRWVAIELLEGDPDTKELVGSQSERVVQSAESLAKEVEAIHKEPSFVVTSSERYSLAARIASDAQKQGIVSTSFSDRLDWITTHRVTGYLISAGAIGGLMLWTFIVGDFLSRLLSDALSILEPAQPRVTGPMMSILWNGAFGGFIAGVTLVIPFVLPFYFMLAMIEDSGFLTRVAFMMDNVMHKIGLHGKAIIPFILGYGCNVPAIYSSRIMETRRERLLAAFVITLAPCSARTVVILGLVAVFVGVQWALALYLIDILLIFALGRIAFKVVPGKSAGLVMEMHSFKVPSFSVVAKQTWTRTKSLIYVVLPIYVLGSALVEVLYAVGLLEPVGIVMSSITAWWLGLPAVTGILLIFGVVRKELTILMLAAIYGTTNFALFLTPVQMTTLALVTMLYIPCLATIAVLAKEFSWKAASAMTLAEISFAIFAGGIGSRLISLVF